MLVVGILAVAAIATSCDGLSRPTRDAALGAGQPIEPVAMAAAAAYRAGDRVAATRGMVRAWHLARENAGVRPRPDDAAEGEARYYARLAALVSDGLESFDRAVSHLPPAEPFTWQGATYLAGHDGAAQVAPWSASHFARVGDARLILVSRDGRLRVWDREARAAILDLELGLFDRLCGVAAAEDASTALILGAWEVSNSTNRHVFEIVPLTRDGVERAAAIENARREGAPVEREDPSPSWSLVESVTPIDEAQLALIADRDCLSIGNYALPPLEILPAGYVLENLAQRLPKLDFPLETTSAPDGSRFWDVASLLESDPLVPTRSRHQRGLMSAAAAAGYQAENNQRAMMFERSKLGVLFWLDNFGNAGFSEGACATAGPRPACHSWGAGLGSDVESLPLFSDDARTLALVTPEFGREGFKLLVREPAEREFRPAAVAPEVPPEWTRDGDLAPSGHVAVALHEDLLSVFVRRASADLDFERLPLIPAPVGHAFVAARVYGDDGVVALVRKRSLGDESDSPGGELRLVRYELPSALAVWQTSIPADPAGAASPVERAPPFSDEPVFPKLVASAGEGLVAVDTGSRLHVFDGRFGLPFGSSTLPGDVRPVWTSDTEARLTTRFTEPGEACAPPCLLLEGRPLPLVREIDRLAESVELRRKVVARITIPVSAE